MKQVSFAEAEFGLKKKRTRREKFLAAMEQVVPWFAAHGGERAVLSEERKGASALGLGEDAAAVFRAAMVRTGRRGNRGHGVRRPCVAPISGHRSVSRESVPDATSFLKAQVRAKVEHPFHVVKNLFRHRKVRYRGLFKNTAQLLTLFALANLVIAKRQLLPAHARSGS
jgi:IS5 family transposase